MILPKLPFGNARADHAAHADDASALLARVVPTITAVTPAHSGPFLCKAAVQRVGSLGLVANAATASGLAVEDSGGWHLAVPCHGSVAIHADGHELALNSGRTAGLLPNFRRRGHTTTRAVCIVSFEHDRLADTLALIAGEAEAEAAPLEARMHTLDLCSHQGLFPTFLQICQMLDGANACPELIAALNLEDTIYRWMASALIHTTRAHGVASRPATARPPAGRDMDILCDMIRTSFERPLSLSEMERVTGVSSRTLQYAFQQRFGCSPMAWQRHERMLMARQWLHTAEKGRITQLAHLMGFSSSAAFAALYRKHFGETPSQTLARAQG